MDVWVEFRNASKWQAELLFRNFFPSIDDDDEIVGDDRDDEKSGTRYNVCIKNIRIISS